MMEDKEHNGSHGPEKRLPFQGFYEERYETVLSNILRSKSRPEPLNEPVKSEDEVENEARIKKFIQDFQDFRLVVRATHKYIHGDVTATDNMTLFEHLKRLQMPQTRNLLESSDPTILDILNKGDEILRDDESWKRAEKQISKYDIDLIELTFETIRRIVRHAIDEDTYWRQFELSSTFPVVNDQLDALLKGENRDTGFLAKYRRLETSRIEDLILEASRIRQNYKSRHSKDLLVVIIVFTLEQTEKLEKYRFIFNQDLGELEPEAKEKIFFLPYNLFELDSLKNDVADIVRR